ncbi:cilia- and flagella-associated protein 251-like [Rhodamnia argentea]|uniref:Cilia- and flagella-associated protein 251-like n=1 Tax=Rhodamnia argentea TaxID=178133 RepID=A0ABM3HYY4_9MYRT|nr:cilia- and flagella-associated protein 251-like [Rhodamnia argentea]
MSTQNPQSKENSIIHFHKLSLPLAFAPNNETTKQKMDQNDNLMKVQTVHKTNNIKNSHFLKRTLKLVISISLLSFVVCYSSGYTLLPHSFNVCFSTVLFSIFTRTLERKFMFLVCNGILAFLAKSSSSSSSSSPSRSDLDGDDELHKKRDGSAFDDLPEEEIKVSASESSEVDAVTAENAATTGDNEYRENNMVLAAEEEAEEEEEEKLQDKVKDKEEQEEQMLQETEFANTAIEEAEEENETWVVEEDGSLSKQEEEEELEECGYTGEKTESPAVATGNEEMMSIEELNKKVEEFIRKMKEEIRIEAKSQLIAV